MSTPTGFWAHMTPRERNLVLVLVLVFFAMGTALLFYLRSGALSRTENEIEKLQLALDTVHTRGAVYKERLEAKKEREKSLSSTELAWSTLVASATESLEGIDMSNEEELPRIELGGGLVKRAYKFQLRNITYDSLVRFLEKIETEPGRIILTENLLIRSHSPVEDRLQVDITLATWERADAEPAEQGAEDDKAVEG